MNKKNSLYILILIMTMALIGIYFAYNRFYYPAAQTYQNYLAVYQEYEQTDVNTLNIISSNHKVEFRKSSDSNIKIAFYQKSDNGNEISLNSKKYTLRIPEVVDNIDNILFKSDKRIDTIIVYLPEGKAFDVIVESVNGSLSIVGGQFNTLVYQQAYGNVSVTDSVVTKLKVVINKGDIEIVNCDINDVEIESAQGNVKVVLTDALDQYNHNYSTKYGKLLINGEEVVEVTVDDETGEESRKVVQDYVATSSTKKKIRVTSTRSNISITSVEPEVEVEAEGEVEG